MGDFTGKWYSVEERGKYCMSWARSVDLATMTYYYVEHSAKELFNGGCNECVRVCMHACVCVYMCQ